MIKALPVERGQDRGSRTKRVTFQLAPPRGPYLVDREVFLHVDFCSSFCTVFKVLRGILPSRGNNGKAVHKVDF